MMLAGCSSMDVWMSVQPHCRYLFVRLSINIDIVDGLGWQRDTSLDVELDVGNISTLKHVSVILRPTSNFLDVGAINLDGTS